MALNTRLEALRVFVQVVDSGGLAAAGRVLGMSAVTVGRRLASLEDELGVRLVERTTRSLSVTPEGQRFYTSSRIALSELDDAMAAIGPTTEPSGVVRVAIPTATVEMGIMQGLQEWLDLYPRVSLKLVVTDQPVDVVGEGMDVAVHVGPPVDSELVARRLVDVVPLLAASESYLARHGTPESPVELASHSTLRFFSDQPQRVWRLHAPGREPVDVPVGGRLEADHSGALLAALHAGVGIGWVPKSVLDQHPNLVRVLPEWTLAPFPVYALMPFGRHRLPRVRALVDFLAEFMARR